MQLDLSSDHLAWDDEEAVTLEVSGRLAPAARVSLPWASGHAVRSRERSPSGGAYAGSEQTWHLPQRDLSAAGLAEVKPGDVVEQADGRRWTVLTAEHCRLRQRWRLGCVNLVLALDLRDTVVIEKATIGRDAAGAAVKVFPPDGGSAVATLPARVQELTQEVADERGLRFARGRYDVTVGRQVNDLDAAEDRVKWADYRTGELWYLDIVEVRNPQRIDELPVLSCERRA